MKTSFVEYLRSCVEAENKFFAQKGKLRYLYRNNGEKKGVIVSILRNGRLFVGGSLCHPKDSPFTRCIGIREALSRDIDASYLRISVIKNNQSNKKKIRLSISDSASPLEISRFNKLPKTIKDRLAEFIYYKLRMNHKYDSKEQIMPIASCIGQKGGAFPVISPWECPDNPVTSSTE